MSLNDMRKMYLTEENIAREAYWIWDRNGRSFGNNLKHWFLAVEHLEMAAEMDAEAISPTGQQIFCDATCEDQPLGAPPKSNLCEVDC
jgi:hypothetical protein